jgi:hypothetical protein
MSDTVRYAPSVSLEPVDGSAIAKSHPLPAEGRLVTEPARLAGPAGRVLLSPRALQVALIVLGVALATFVLYLYVLPNSQMDAARVRIADLQVQKAALERQNAALHQQIASASNLTTLEARAKALGMGPARNTIYLRLPGSEVPAPAAQAVVASNPASAGSPATLAEWLQPEHLQDMLREIRSKVSGAVDSIIQRFGGLP